METYIQLKSSILKSKELDIYEKVIISYILSFIDRGLKFYSTNEQISEELEITLITIKKKIKSLIDKEFILSENAKTQYPNKKWGNRRVIVLGKKLTNNTSTTDDSQNIQSNEVKSIEPITTTTTTVKVQQREENPVNSTIEIDDILNNDKFIDYIISKYGEEKGEHILSNDCIFDEYKQFEPIPQ
jgi:hypothetical protein